MATHAPELNLFELTMSQTKALYLVVAAGQLRMSELAGRLGVTSSTATGVVDGLVGHGLLVRHEDPADRRQVVVTATAGGRGDPRVVPRAQRQPHARAARPTSMPRTSRSIERAIHLLDAAVTADAPDRSHHRPTGGPFVNRLYGVRRQQAQRHAPARRRPVHRRHLGLGQPQAGAAAGHRVPGHHGHRPVPGRGLRGRRRPGRRARSSGPSPACPGCRPSSRPRPTRSPWSSPSSSTGPTSRKR